MTGRIFPNAYELDWSKDTNLPHQASLQQSQDLIYKSLKSLVNSQPPETVLLEFKNLFISGDSSLNPEGLQALYKIILNNDEQEFKNTLKRSCYILINNWASQRKFGFIQELIQILAAAKETPTPLSPSLKRLKSWIINFVNQEDYQELKLFAAPHLSQERGYWSHRYTSYLLVPQYLDSRNPKEQREIARNLSQRLKEKFKLDLAMYTARCNSSIAQNKEVSNSNPTKLGEGVIGLIKKVITRTTLFDYTNQAHIFLQQTRELNYLKFKHRLKSYLGISIQHKKGLEILPTKFYEKIDNLYETHNQDSLNVDLLLRTSRQIIEWLTTEDGQEPSYLFIVLTTQGNTLTLVVILLKVILICQYVRTYLEVCIAKLIRYYEKYPEKECQWFINFLEIFNLVMAIYTENVQYNLVQVKDNHSENQLLGDLDTYRVFSQFKGADLRGNDLSNTDLRHSDLSAADMREANLCGTDLTQADLSLAKLSNANMSRAILNEAELIAADLNHADLSGATLIATKLRHADLHQANLSHATLNRATLNASTLSGADLREADLQYTDLSYANLNQANLSGANLQYADLSNASLSGANLSGANLQNANLSHANLHSAKLPQANLSRADLESVNLRGANLQGALLRHVKLSHGNLSGANLSRADLSHAELSCGNLRGANLSDALLRHVNLSGADLRDANLKGANLFSTHLNCADITHAQFGENSEFFELNQERVDAGKNTVCERLERITLD
ncbi:pentapeptide repeat-containing protein [Microcoleus sp. FACHB-53]|nr:pentapeptide repeat-containing protein [Microcoleus sp. FACHB-53]